MNEEISKQLAALNATWQLYARAIEQDLDSIPREALNRDYLAARDGLAALGIVESKLVYDFARMTFSLPKTEILTDKSCSDMLPAPVDPAADSQESDDNPGLDWTQLI